MTFEFATAGRISWPGCGSFNIAEIHIRRTALIIALVLR